MDGWMAGRVKQMLQKELCLVGQYPLSSLFEGSPAYTKGPAVGI